MTNNEEHLKTLRMLRDLELALNESSIITITDSEGVIQFVNDNFCDISQYPREELIGKKQNITNSGYHSERFFQDLWQTIRRGHVWKGEIRNRAKDGSYFWFDTTIVPFLTEDNEPYKYIGIRHDITEQKKYEKTIKQMVFYDPLTLLPNRNFLGEWLEQKSFQKDETLAVLFLNIDRFKS